MTTTTMTGYVACNASQGDMLSDVEHGAIRSTEAEAIADRDAGYETVRYVAPDGYLYVDRPE